MVSDDRSPVSSVIKDVENAAWVFSTHSQHFRALRFRPYSSQTWPLRKYISALSARTEQCFARTSVNFALSSEAFYPWYILNLTCQNNAC